MAEEPYVQTTTPAPPDMGPNAVATICKGHTMGPIVDGALCFYENEMSQPTPEMFGKLCICTVVMGTRYVRHLQPGSRPGLYNLVSVTGETMEDVALQWAEPVKWVRLP